MGGAVRLRPPGLRPARPDALRRAHLARRHRRRDAADDGARSAARRRRGLRGWARRHRALAGHRRLGRYPARPGRGGAAVRVEERGPAQLVLVLSGWPPMVRVLRASVAREVTADHVLAARALGAGHLRVLRRHVLPGSLRPLLVFGSAYGGVVVAAEATLTFSGGPPHPVLGHPAPRGAGLAGPRPPPAGARDLRRGRRGRVRAAGRGAARLAPRETARVGVRWGRLTLSGERRHDRDPLHVAALERAVALLPRRSRHP